MQNQEAGTRHATDDENSTAKPAATRSLADGSIHAEQQLLELLDCGARVWRQREDLCFETPPGSLKTRLREDLRRHKPEILAHLEEGESLALPSFAQERLLILEALQPGMGCYLVHSSLHLRLRGHLPALLGAMRALVRRHAVLASAFRSISGRPVHFMRPGCTPSLAVVDLRGLPSDRLGSSGTTKCDRALVQVLEREARLPFSLPVAPLLRCTLLQLPAGDHLLLSLHHLLCDGPSMLILQRELILLYEAGLEAKSARLPPLPLGYTEFSRWQRALMRGPELQRQLDFWREELAELPTLQLSTDRPRRADQPGPQEGAAVRLSLRPDITVALQKLARRHKASLFHTLLAAVVLLMHRLTQQRDLAVDSPVNLRDDARLEGAVGLFVNNLVLRSNLDSPKETGGEGGGWGSTFVDLLEQVKLRALRAHAARQLPFERLVSELGLDRRPGQPPLTRVSLAYTAGNRSPRRNSPLQKAALEPGTLHPPVRWARNDLEIFLWHEAQGGLEGKLIYASDLFDHSSAARLAHSLHTLLRQAASQPHSNLAQLPLLGPGQRQQVKVDWSGFASPAAQEEQLRSDRNPPLCRQLDTAAEAFTHRIALAAGRHHFSYGAVHCLVSHLAEALRQLGAAAEWLVGVALPTSADQVLAMLAIHRVGAAWIPLEPQSPKQRMAFYLRDARPQILLSWPKHLARINPLLGGDTRALALAPGWGNRALADPPARRTTAAPRVVADDDRAAYLLYTSGSSGQPKGVLVSRRALAQHLDWNLELARLREGHRVLRSTPASFDPVLWQTWCPLLSGARIELPPTQDSAASPARLAQRLARRRITHLDSVPSLLWLLAEQPATQQCRALGMVISGGEALTARVVSRLRQVLGHSELINAYGPTECTVTATFARVEPSPKAPSIGRPAAGVVVWVVDPRLCLLPPGVPGQLLIGGTQLARGYRDRPGLTSARFVPAPDAWPGARAYLSGDLARWRPDGQLDYLGRSDDQVQIRGQRVEPAEIERILLNQERIQEAAVRALRRFPMAAAEPRTKDTPRNPVLVAYVVPTEAPGDDWGSWVANLRAVLGEHLPAACQPSAWVQLRQLPRTAAGKLDPSKLPVPATDPAPPQAVAPRNRRERALLQIWQEVLGVREIGMGDDFFSLGGHSLLALQLAARVEQSFACRLPLASILRGPTVAAMARELDRLRRAQLPDTDPGQQPRHLVSLAPSLAAAQSTGRPLFCIHPMGGHVLCYAQLARRLASRRQIWGLQARLGHRFSSLEAMARTYLGEVRAAQPQGRYALAGWSMGGIVAFEMARQLSAQGEGPAQVLLLDVAAPQTPAPGLNDREGNTSRGGAKVKASPDRLSPLHELRHLLRGLGVWPPRRAQWARLPGEWLDLLRLVGRYRLLSVGKKHLLSLCRQHRYHCEMLASYQPRPCNVELHLFRIGGRSGPAALGWDQLLGFGGTVRVHTVSGKHQSMLREPHVGSLAAAMARQIQWRDG